MHHLQELLGRLLGGEVKLFTTPCVSGELRGLGPDFAAAAHAARQQQLHKCGHAAALPACDCLLEAVSGGNPGHWWVATQDKALQGELGGLRCVPVLFASVNGLHLAEPADAAKAEVAAGHAAAQALPAHELQSEALKDLHELRPRDTGYKKFRRKFAKGPNPLAVKKKKEAKGGGVGGGAAAAAAGGGGGGGAEAAAAAGARKRKRKKHMPGGGEGGGRDE